MATLHNRIQAFIDEADSMISRHYREKEWSVSVPVHEIEYGAKWAKVVRTGSSVAGRCVYAFIALKDFETKVLGKVRAGDVHGAASWTSPAAGSKLNVNEDLRNKLWVYGVTYLSKR